MAHWYPVAREVDGRVPHRWYFGWALYVNRLGYRAVGWKVAIALVLLVVGGLFLSNAFLWAALAIVNVGLWLLAWSLLGHWLIYGRPGLTILRRALTLAGAESPREVVDLHVGAWRKAVLRSSVPFVQFSSERPPPSPLCSWHPGDFLSVCR